MCRSAFALFCSLPEYGADVLKPSAPSLEDSRVGLRSLLPGRRRNAVETRLLPRMVSHDHRLSRNDSAKNCGVAASPVARPRDMAAAGNAAAHVPSDPRTILPPLPP
jgi:hypothetical protein